MIVDRIKLLLEEKNLKQKDVIEATGANQSRVAKWLSMNDKIRQDIPYEYLVKIANLLNTSVDFLMGNEKEKVAKVRTVPLIGCASCGTPKEYDLNGYDQVPVSEELYREGMYAVKAEGDSMSPKINENAIVYCCINEHIDNGNIVHYSIDGESGIKKYKINEKGDIISLIPINSDFDIITIHADDHVDFKMAKVMGAMDMDF